MASFSLIISAPSSLFQLCFLSFSVASFFLTLSASISLNLSISAASLSLPQHKRINGAY